jgi:hypothetical protein
LILVALPQLVANLKPFFLGCIAHLFHLPKKLPKSTKQGEK